MSDNVVIVAAGRTAIGAFSGGLAGIPAHKLGANCHFVLARTNRH